MEHNTDRILWTVLILAIGVGLYVSFRPVANGLLQQGVEKIQDVVTNVNGNTSDSSNSKSNSSSSRSSSHTAVGTNLIIQSDLNYGYLDRNNGSVMFNGNATGGGYDFHSDNYIATNGATVFTFSSPDYAFKGSGNDTLVMYDSNKNYLGYQFITSPTQTLSKSNVAYIRFSINFTNDGGTYGNLSDWLNTHRYKLEKGSKATPWMS